MNYAIGIKFGKLTISTGIVNQYGDVIQLVVMAIDPTDGEKTFDNTVKSVEKLLVHSSIPFSQIKGIGIGLPCDIKENATVVSYQETLPWNGFPLKQRIYEAFKLERIVIETDKTMAMYAKERPRQITATSAEYYVAGAGLRVFKEMD